MLRSGAHAQLLNAFFGDLEYRELSQLAKVAATRKRARATPVFILPGIMGSRLAMKRGRLLDLYWLHPAAIAQGQLLELALPGSPALRPIGVMLPGYLKMKLMLEIAGFKPVLHAFDWRADIERNARALVRDIDRSGARKVLVVAHSMGGLIARAALRYDKQRCIAKLVQLGAPNSGSFGSVIRSKLVRVVVASTRRVARRSWMFGRVIALLAPRRMRLLSFRFHFTLMEGSHFTSSWSTAYSVAACWR